MVELKVYLSDGLNEKFRRLAMAVYGYGRGSLSKAAEEALSNWCTERDGASQKANKSSSVENAGEQKASTGSGINPDERPHDSEKPAAGKDKGASHDSGQTEDLSEVPHDSERQSISISWKPDTNGRLESHG